MKIKELINEYLLSIVVEKGLSKETINAYKTDLRLFLSYLGDESELCELNLENINNYLETLNKEHLNKNSIIRKMSSIRNFIVYLCIRENFKFDLTSLESMKKGKTLPKIVSQSQINEMLSLLPRESNDDKLFLAMIYLSYFCGLRVSELINLSMDNLSIEKKQLKIKGKGAKERVVPIYDEAMDILMMYLNDVRNVSKYSKEKYVFINKKGKKISRQRYYLIIKEAFKRINIENASPHTLRHCFASHLLANDMPLTYVKALLGHEDIKTTEIYTHVENKHLKDEYDKMMK